MASEKRILEDLSHHFPSFAEKVRAYEPEHLRDGLSGDQLDKLEKELGVPLPSSYRTFLRCCGQMWLMGGVIQFAEGHPFFHNFPPLSELSPRQIEVVRARGGSWPPPSQGMLCFAEFFLEADGDQVLFDVSAGLNDGEYPVMYYAHEGPAVRLLASSFREFMEGCLDHVNLDEE